MFKANHPPDTKQRGVYIYHKICPPLKMINIKYIQECVTPKLQIRDQLGSLIRYIDPQIKIRMFLKILQKI